MTDQPVFDIFVQQSTPVYTGMGEKARAKRTWRAVCTENGQVVYQGERRTDKPEAQQDALWVHRYLKQHGKAPGHRMEELPVE